MEREIEAQAGARGRRARAPRGGVAAGYPGGSDVSDLGGGTPRGAGTPYGCGDGARGDGDVTGNPREATGKLNLAKGGATRVQSPKY